MYLHLFTDLPQSQNRSNTISAEALFGMPTFFTGRKAANIALTTSLVSIPERSNETKFKITKLHDEEDTHQRPKS